MTPIFSVIMPAYNSELTIFDSIESVVEQTFLDFELLVVDDHSSDSTVKIVQQCCHSDARVKLLSNHYPKGASGARNTALDSASGRYISFLDSDDYWLSNHLHNMYCAFRRGYVIAHSDYNVVNASGRFLYEMRTPQVVTSGMMIFSNFLPNLTVGYDSHYFGKVYSPYFSSRNDYALWLELFAKDHSVVSNKSHSAPSACYRLSPGGLSGRHPVVNLVKYFSVVSSYYPAFLVLLSAPIYLFLIVLKKKVPSFYNCLVLRFLS